MSIISYIKIGAAVAIIAVLGYFVWNYQHMQTKIAGLEEKVAGLELRAEIVEKAQAATDAFMKKKTTVQSRVVKEKANVDKIVEAGDNNAMRDLYIRNRLLEDNRNNPPSGATGNTGNPPGR